MARILLGSVKPIGFPGYDGSARVDVLVNDGRIEQVGFDLETDDAEIREMANAYLSPAWIDIHTHVYYGGSDIALRPETIGVATGAPILVDAGSAGEGHFNGLVEYVIDRAREQIVPFLNVGSIGLVATNRVPEVRLLQDIDIERTLATIEKYKPLIAGLKVRLCSIIQAESDLLPLKLAKKLSRYAKLPLMTHIGRPLPLVEEVLDRLDPGDICTHCFQGKPASSVVDDDRAFAALFSARDRGVVLDIGHGSASFSYRVARECMDKGIFPTVIGSDLHTGNIDGPVWDLSVVLSKLLCLGMSLEDTIAGATSSARTALRMEPAMLEPGAPADFTLFETEDCDLTLPDSLGDTLTLTTRILPKAVLWRGELTPAASRLPVDAQAGHHAGGTT
ncbi:MAG: amidohydrolase/deacetylase family metallohydrolase [Planctomycetaceae bacterium]|nr:amidohydrolase/deacetylase family metallohydrolase [Planctomycetaceae bacterium]